MQEAKFDVWSPIDNKNILPRLFWIVGSLVSLVLLLVSLFLENAILSVLDVLLPTVIILYGLVKRKKFPIYYYTTCLSGLYPIIWLVIITTCDFNKENPQEISPLTAYIIILVVGLTAILVLNSLFIRKRKKQKNRLIKPTSFVLYFEKTMSFLILASILGSLVLNLNVICDKPYKVEQVYLKNIKYYRDSVDVFYTKKDSNIQYQIKADNHNKIIHTNDWREDWLYLDENGNEVFEIEYGNGAFGTQWRRVVENK